MFVICNLKQYNSSWISNSVMSYRLEMVKLRNQVEVLKYENNDLQGRLKLMAGVIEELMKAQEGR